MTPAARTILLEAAARLRAEAARLELLAGDTVSGARSTMEAESSVQALLGHEDARVTARIYSHAVAGAQAMGAARAVGEYLDRAMAARPQIKAVK